MHVRLKNIVLVCISAANILHKPRGTSYQVCELACRLAREQDAKIHTEIIALTDYDLTPCTGCGSCYQAGKCCQNDDFNRVLNKLHQADGLIVVSAHYAPIPSKLAMLLEKAEQLAFLPRFHKDTSRSPLYGKPAGIIGHGGGTAELMEGYVNVVLRTIANALAYPIEMDIVRLGHNSTPGVIFPVAKVSRDPNSPFPVQEYDWADIHQRIAPLVEEVVARMAKLQEKSAQGGNCFE